MACAYGYIMYLVHIQYSGKYLGNDFKLVVVFFMVNKSHRMQDT